MKRVSLIVALAILLSTLGYSAVFAQSTTPNNGSSSSSSSLSRTQVPTSPANPCGYGDLEGQVKHGKLYTSPTFNLRQWLKHNPHVTMEELTKANAGVNASNTSGNASCTTIILPSM